MLEPTISENNISEIGGSTIALQVELNSKSMNGRVTQIYKRRYWMMFLFSFLSFLCGMLFPMYVSSANVNMCYYNVSMHELNWTVYMFMVTYIVLMFPVSYIMNYIGLRWTVIAGAVFNTTACALQFTGLKPNGFPYIVGSQFFAALANILLIAVPPFLAATWFPSIELSRACAAGVFGNQMGVAIGYLFSPLMISNNCSDKALIEAGKIRVSTILTAVNVCWLVLVVFTFQNAPKFPPTLSQVKKESTKSHVKLIISMFRNVNFNLLFIMYGLMVGAYFAITTVLNNLILLYFPHKEVEIGWMGTIFVASGLVGSIIAGYILDYTHRFKETSFGICVASLVTYIIFCSLLTIKKLWVTFLTLAISGFFLTSFLPVGLEYGIEVTFPEPEVISSSLLNGATNIFGLILTPIISNLLDFLGPKSSNAALVLTLFISSVITIFITSDYKRSKKSTVNVSQTQIDDSSKTQIDDSSRTSMENHY